MKYLSYVLTGLILGWMCMQGMHMDIYRLYRQWNVKPVRHHTLTMLEIKLTRPLDRLLWCINKRDGRIHFDKLELPLDLSAPMAEITAGMEDRDEKIRAIYGWIVEHIEYDYTYQVASADECYRQRKGVCNGFAELLVKMLDCADIPAIKVSGEIKYRDTGIHETTHAWALIENAQGKFIFADATWDACERRRNPDGPYRWRWFDLSPEEAIFTHRPHLDYHQRLEQPLTRQEFARLPYAGDSERCAGVDMTDYLKACLSGTAVALPVMYMPGMFSIASIPLTAELKKGVRQTMVFSTPRPLVCAIMHNGKIVCADARKQRHHRLVFSPWTAGKWSIVYKLAPNRYCTLVEYVVQ